VAPLLRAGVMIIANTISSLVNSRGRAFPGAAAGAVAPPIGGIGNKTVTIEAKPPLMIGVPLRFKTAVALVLLGLLTLLAGIGQRTFWAPAETFTASASADGQAAPLTVIDQKLRTLHGGTVKIKVEGDGNFLLAAGRPDDVDAWVGKTAHNTVTGVSEDKSRCRLNMPTARPRAEPGRLRSLGFHRERQRRA
jgi:hypothetical protein